MKIFRRIEGCTLFDIYKTNVEFVEELKAEPLDYKLGRYK
jgi:hypothetical protein